MCDKCVDKSLTGLARMLKGHTEFDPLLQALRAAYTQSKAETDKVDAELSMWIAEAPSPAAFVAAVRKGSTALVEDLFAEPHRGRALRVIRTRQLWQEFDTQIEAVVKLFTLAAAMDGKVWGDLHHPERDMSLLDGTRIDKLEEQAEAVKEAKERKQRLAEMKESGSPLGMLAGLIGGAIPMSALLAEDPGNDDDDDDDDEEDDGHGDTG